MVVESQDGQTSKNQKKSQGTTTPPSVGFGDSTGVVTGMMKPPAVSDEDEAGDGNEVTLGLMVVDRPSGNLVAIGVVMPVGMVMIPSPLLETMVSPAEFVPVKAAVCADEESDVSVDAGIGVKVVDSPFGSIVSIGVVTVELKVTALSAFDTTVSPAASVVTMMICAGSMVVV